MSTPETTLRDRIADALTQFGDVDQHAMADAVLAVLPAPVDRAAESAQLREKYTAGLRRADELNNALMEEVQRYAAGTERPVLWSVYNEMHKRALNAEAEVERLRRLATEAPQPECTASISGNCLRESQSDGVCDTDDGECVHGGRPGAEAPQPDTEARPRQESWRVETYDPAAGQWAPGSHFLRREAAVERCDTANGRAPRWMDGTPVQRRIVRETTTYTVEPSPTGDEANR